MQRWKLAEKVNELQRGGLDSDIVEVKLYKNIKGERKKYDKTRI